MKRRSLVICLFIIGYITICSYKNGPGTNGWDCTGAESGLGNVAGCRTCHGTTATSAITCLIELDSSGVSTTQYVGGGIYTVTITGTNNSTFSLPKYGFQMACLRGSTAITTPIPAGIWSGLPVSTHIANPSAGNFVLTNVEQTSVLAATLGTGATGTI